MPPLRSRSVTLVWSTPDPLIVICSWARRVGASCLVWPNADSVEKARLYAYTLAHGPLSEGRELRTRCGTPWCVNPFHFVKHRVNVRNGVTHCIAGHPYYKGSYYWQQNGRGGRVRVCKECFNERRRAWREKKKEKLADAA